MTIKVGRLTAAALLVAVGAALLFDRWLGTSFLAVLLEWWPLVLVLLGVEYLYYGMGRQAEGVRMKMDIASIVGAVVVSAVIGVITNWPALAQLESWTKSTVNVPLAEMSNLFDEAAPWQQRRKGTVTVPLAGEIDIVSFHNDKGRVAIRSGRVDDIQVDVKVAAPGASEDEMSGIVENTKLYVEDGSKLTVAVKAARYGAGSGREPRVDLDITVPQGRSVLWEVHGSVGDIDAEDLDGAVKLYANVGDIRVRSVRGNVAASTAAGEIEVSGATGDIDVETTTGDIELNEVLGALRAKTTNGEIEASTAHVGGAWKVETTLGDVKIDIPAAGDYTIHGQTTIGEVDLEADDDSAAAGFSVTKRSMEGKRGGGTHPIEANTQGDLEIVLR
ncbi:DUF4097 family beta strand repeat-containing protein [Paenibacillus alkalitolerans]|uniref:DUF4097 family beta strand repeat-containing protein n=1 Tax=Paenibacillus alkalitolerans TaxID=2799335 RepID=UPI0018F2C742|nr:DUF4097 family beta strand repeat-containing protein [Paenibacillus alkalitolerans]